MKWWFLFLLVACSAVDLVELKKELKASQEDFKKVKLINGTERWTRGQTFLNEKEALEYALERRLSLQQFYEKTSEPYFGTPASKDCRDGVDTKAEIENLRNGKYFFLKLLAGPHFGLGDCLKENNYFQVYYEFYICGHRVYEIRHFSLLTQPLSKKASLSSCP